MSSGQTINNESVKGLTVKRNMKEKVLCIIVILIRVALYLFCLYNIFIQAVWFVKNTWVSRTESERINVTISQTAIIIILAFGAWGLLNAADQYATRILHKKLPFTDAEKTFNLKSGSDDMPECAETKTPNND